MNKVEELLRNTAVYAELSLPSLSPRSHCVLLHFKMQPWARSCKAWVCLIQMQLPRYPSLPHRLQERTETQLKLFGVQDCTKFYSISFRPRLAAF